jgi:hypothetical protein
VTKRPSPDTRLRILAACFEGVYEHRFLDAAITETGLLVHAGDREGLVFEVVSTRPSLLIVPAVDAAGVATAALVEQCVTRAPDVPILVVIPAQRTTGRAIARAMHSGAEVVSIASAHELQSAVERVLRGRLIPDDDAARLEQLLAGLAPSRLAELLRDAVVVAHEGISVERLAGMAGRSRRSLSRDFELACWPPPHEVIVWSRLFRASLANHGPSTSIAALVRSGGFNGVQALRRACETLLGVRGEAHEKLGAGRVSIAFRARLDARPD